MLRYRSLFFSAVLTLMTVALIGSITRHKSPQLVHAADMTASGDQSSIQGHKSGGGTAPFTVSSPPVTSVQKLIPGCAFQVGSVASSVTSRTYGPANEPCTTNGIVLQPSDDWEKRLKGAKPGDVFLLRAGTYILTDTLILPSGSADKPILLKSYNCDAATILGKSSKAGHGVVIRPGSYNTIASLRIESATHEKLIELGGNTHHVAFRNNALYGGRNNAITIHGGVAHILFEGNDINSGPGQLPGVTGSSGGHVFVVAPRAPEVPHDVRIIRNKIRGSYFGDVTAGDDTIAVAGGNHVVIEENWFTENFNIENVIDIKSRLSRVPVIIRGNVLENNFLGTHGGQGGGPIVATDGPEIIIGDHDEPSALQQHVIECNRLERGISIGSSKRRGSALIRNNVFRAKATTAPRIVFNHVYNTLVINNTFYRGGFKIGRARGCIPVGGLTFKNNIFYETFVRDQTDGCHDNSYILIHNNLYKLPSGFKRGMQQHNITTDPHFMNPVTGDLRLKADSPARRIGEGGIGIGHSPQGPSHN